MKELLEFKSVENQETLSIGQFLLPKLIHARKIIVMMDISKNIQMRMKKGKSNKL